jgi:hypothetical protein
MIPPSQLKQLRCLLARGYNAKLSREFNCSRQTIHDAMYGFTTRPDIIEAARRLLAEQQQNEGLLENTLEESKAGKLKPLKPLKHSKHMLTVFQAAEETGYTARYIRKLFREGVLEGKKEGRNLYLFDDEIAQLRDYRLTKWNEGTPKA